MSKLIKYVAMGAAAIVLLLVVAGVAVSLLVDPNDYRDEIAATVLEDTGRQLQFDGDIQLQAFPCCSLALGALSLGNPVGWDETEFASVNTASVSVRLLPLLLNQELQVGDVQLDGLRLNLIARSDGTTNWDFAGDEEVSEESAETDVPAGTQAFEVAGVNITDAQLHYRDLAAGDDIRLSGINLNTGPVRVGQPVDVELAIAAEGLVPDQIVDVKLNTTALYDSDGNALALDDLRASLDDTNISGWLKVPDIEAGSLAFDLQIDQLNADTYMASSDGAEDDEGSSGETESSEEIPVGAVRALQLDGTVAIGELVFEGATLTDVMITASADDGLVRLHPLQASLYGGSYAGDVRLNVQGKTPELSVNEQLTGVQLASLLADTAELTNLTGAGNISINATARGQTVTELLEQLSGAVSFDLRDGIYQGVDIWHEIRKARASLKQDAAPPEPENPLTELSEFAGTLNFSGGAIDNPEFSAKIPFMRLTGSGSFNLLDTTLDYSLRAKVVDTPTFDDGEDLGQLEGLAVPVRITGSLDSPGVTVDLGELARNIAEQELEEKEDELKERINDKLRSLFD